MLHFLPEYAKNNLNFYWWFGRPERDKKNATSKDVYAKILTFKGK